MNHCGSESTKERQELIDVASRYLRGIERQDMSQVPFSLDVKITVNSRLATLNEGHFTHFRRFHYPRQYVVDVIQSQIGIQAIGEDAIGDCVYACRLRVVAGRVVESETLISHEGECGPAFLPIGFLTREAPYISVLPILMRSSRNKLLEIAAAYWKVATSNHDPELVRFSLNCARMENGMNTTWEHEKRGCAFFAHPVFNPQEDGRCFTCAAELAFSTKHWKAIRDYRAICDEERGLVMSWNLIDAVAEDLPLGFAENASAAAAMFHARLEADSFGADDVPPGLTPRGMVSNPGPFVVYHAETQRISNGHIDRQQVFMHVLPPDAISPWL